MTDTLSVAALGLEHSRLPEQWPRSGGARRPG